MAPLLSQISVPRYAAPMAGDGVTPPLCRPFYISVGNEERVFKAAFRQGLSVLLKGPTGCGKTRFLEAMAYDLHRPLITVACHDDLTTADLVGRFLLRGGDTDWVDGPLTRAVREGAICYLDEVVEARQDTTVVLHPLADHRRQLPIDRLGVTLDAAPGFAWWCPTTPGTRVCSRTSRTRRASAWSPSSSAFRPLTSRRRSSPTRPASAPTRPPGWCDWLRRSGGWRPPVCARWPRPGCSSPPGRLIAEGLSPCEAATRRCRWAAHRRLRCRDRPVGDDLRRTWPDPSATIDGETSPR